MMTAAPAKRRFAIPDLLPAVGIAIGLHFLWLWMPLGPVPPPPAPPRVPTLTAFVQPDSQVWSPILFSLPSPMGFSGATRGDPVSILPPLLSRLDLGYRHAIDLREWFAEPPLPPLFSAPPHVLLTVSGLAPEQGAPSPVRWVLRSLEDGAPRLLSFRPPRLIPGERPFVVEGVLEFNRFGQVERFLVDPPGAPESRRAEVHGSLRLLRISPSYAPARVRFRLSLEPVEP